MFVPGSETINKTGVTGQQLEEAKKINKVGSGFSELNRGPWGTGLYLGTPRGKGACACAAHLSFPGAQ
jgi:hypothetical protein